MASGHLRGVGWVVSEQRAVAGPPAPACDVY
jgi:hypothetical protein